MRRHQRPAAHPARSDGPRSTDRVVAYHESFTAAADEHFVGLGEKFTGFDKRGQRAVMWNFDAFGAESDRVVQERARSTCPAAGYGCWSTAGMPTEFDMCQSTHSCVQILVPDDLIDYYVIAGPTPPRCSTASTRSPAARCCRRSGPSAPGSRPGSSWTPRSGCWTRARRIRDAGIPCDVLHLDCYWQIAGHWSDLRLGRDQLPRPGRRCWPSSREQGFKVSLWMNSVHHRT